ncbi:MAG: ELWxxDGT repeat protein, partial [Pararhodobacter sp.]
MTHFLFSARSLTVGGGFELWFSDGTEEGTRLVRDINPGPGDSAPRALTPLNDGRVVFSAIEPETGRGLWITDGTEAGTALVTELEPGQAGNVTNLAPFGTGRALFSGFSMDIGSEPRLTDGTAEGTVALANIHEGLNPNFAVPFPSSSSPRDFFMLDDSRALFSALDSAHGREIWITDGTTDGTRLVKDINPGPESSNPWRFFSLDDTRALFIADDGTHGTELWVTDGTDAGTFMVKDIYPGQMTLGENEYNNSSSPQSFAMLGDGRVLFAAVQEAALDMWVTDGTEDGTVRFSDVVSGPEGRLGSPVALDDGRAIFINTFFNNTLGLTGRELWVTDGTEDGTERITDWSHVSAVPTQVSNLAAIGGGRALFFANDPENGRSLWITDMTEAGTAHVQTIGDADSLRAVHDIVPLSEDRAVVLVRPFGNTTDPVELWITDGTPEGTGRLRDDIRVKASEFGRGTTVLPIPLPEVAIVPLEADRNEGDAGVTQFTFTVSLSSVALTDISVDYTVTGSGDAPADGTDLAGGALPSGTISFVLGETEQTLVIPVQGDLFHEPDESFLVTLSNPQGATLAPEHANAAGIIRNDDPPPQAQDDLVSVMQDQDAAGNVLANDTGAELVVATIDGIQLDGETQVTGALGTLTIAPDGSFSYLADQAVHLPAGVEHTDSFDYTVREPAGATASATLTITITGVNDPAGIAGDISGAVTEDDTAQQVAAGVLTITDPDAGEDRFADPDPAALQGNFGTFAFDPLTGAWAYTLDNNAEAVQALGAGEQVTDSLSVTSLDGTASETITIT